MRTLFTLRIDIDFEPDSIPDGLISWLSETPDYTHDLREFLNSLENSGTDVDIVGCIDEYRL